MNNFSVIGSGFSGLSAASFLAKHGHKVTVFEKNSAIGGRARVLQEGGFTFDMGPSWYWMPDIFENFFKHFDAHPSQYYDLVRLDPGFQIIFGHNDVLQVPASLEGIYDVFEQIETGSAQRLKKFLSEAAFKYTAGMQQLAYTPCFSWTEFLRGDVIKSAARMHMFTSVRSYVRQYFRDERLVALMEFPVLFLGAMAQHIPAMYSMMNYAALSLGTWYPMGGMGRITDAMLHVALSQGVTVEAGCPVNRIEVNGHRATHIHALDGVYNTDGIIATGDYHHIEHALLEEQYRNYDEGYWQKRTFAPSSLIFYLGVNKRVSKLIHHNLFFDESLDEHAKDIYENPQWPRKPLFYVCCPSKTDPSVAPKGMENLFVLVPIAAGLEDTEALRQHYYNIIMKRLEAYCGESIAPNIVYKKSYCVKDFEKDYNAYKGNAYGLANTIKQTAVLKPSLRNKTVKNLFYAGQLTVPGPGVPPALISGQIAASQLLKTFKAPVYETIV